MQTITNWSNLACPHNKLISRLRLSLAAQSMCNKVTINKPKTPQVIRYSYTTS